MSAGWSFTEIFLIFFIGLIVLGPERLPRVANQVGTWIGKARRMTRVMKRQLEDELDVEKHLGLHPSMTQTPRDDDEYSPLHDDDEPQIGNVSPSPETTASETKKDNEQRDG